MATLAELQTQVDTLSAELQEIKTAYIPVKTPKGITIEMEADQAVARARVVITKGIETSEQWVDVTDKFTQDELLAIITGLTDKI